MRALALLVSVGALCASGCSRPDAAASTRTDAGASAPRIVSVGGAITETVFALGAGDRVVGVDTSSVFPESLGALSHVGYQRALSAEGVLALTPTLVLASNEAGPPAAIEQLRNAGTHVEIVSADASAAGAHERISKIGALLGRDPAPALAALDADLATASKLVTSATTKPRVLVLYARGENTMFVFGRGSSADAMVKLAGSENAVTAFEGTKPLTSEAVVQAAPDVIVLPSRGLESIGGVDGLLKLPGLAETPAGKTKRVVAIDDLLLLGFGPRTGRAAIELARKLHPELADKGAP